MRGLGISKLNRPMDCSGQPFKIVLTINFHLLLLDLEATFSKILPNFRNTRKHVSVLPLLIIQKVPCNRLNTKKYSCGEILAHLATAK